MTNVELVCADLKKLGIPYEHSNASLNTIWCPVLYGNASPRQIIIMINNTKIVLCIKEGHNEVANVLEFDKYGYHKILSTILNWYYLWCDKE